MKQLIKNVLGITLITLFLGNLTATVFKFAVAYFEIFESGFLLSINVKGPGQNSL